VKICKFEEPSYNNSIEMKPDNVLSKTPVNPSTSPNGDATISKAKCNGLIMRHKCYMCGHWANDAIEGMVGVKEITKDS
jgi:hypothetical protein